MAIKTDVSTDLGVTVSYENIFLGEIIHSNRSYELNITMHGWADKKYCRNNPKSYPLNKTYSITLTSDEYDTIMSKLYEVAKNHVDELSSATVIYDVSSLSLSSTSLSIEKGSTSSITATCSPDTASDLTVSWSSSDESIATVSSDGTVTAVSEGSAVITATSNDESSVSASCSITVTSSASSESSTTSSSSS